MRGKSFSILVKAALSACLVFLFLLVPVSIGNSKERIKPRENADITVYATLQPYNLTLSIGPDMHPRFSPDGGWIVFTSSRGGFNDEMPLFDAGPQPYGEIWAKRIPWGPAIRLTHNKWEDSLPDWGSLDDNSEIFSEIRSNGIHRGLISNEVNGRIRQETTSATKGRTDEFKKERNRK